MENLTSMPFEYDDTNEKALRELWGNSLEKLTPKQRQLVVEILSCSELQTRMAETANKAILKPELGC
jgi:isochorismate hydrolase